MRNAILCVLAVMLLAVCTACQPGGTEAAASETAPSAMTPTPPVETDQTADAELEESALTDQPTPTAQTEQAVPTVSDEDEGIYPAYIGLLVYRNGESREGYSAETDAQKQIVQDAVFNYMIKSAAWKGVDIDTLDKCIQISEEYENGDTAVYYVFDKDGAHCMQAGENGMYSIISDEVYQPLFELAMGWMAPHTMKITSGGVSIYAVRNWVWSQTDGLNADGMRLTPQEVANDIQYITLADDFAPYIDGQQTPGVVFTLYNEQFEEIEYPVPSGLAAWTYIGRAGAGTYIAAAEYSFEDGNDSEGYQYFFGLIIPEQEK